MRPIKLVLALLFATFLAGCASSPYPEGVTSADVPAHINVVSISPPTAGNDPEIVAVATSAIRNQLVNYGYKVVEDDQQPCDVSLKFSMSYQREIVLVNRGVYVKGLVYDNNKRLLLDMHVSKEDGGGAIGALLNAMMSSRDEFISDAARAVTVNIVTELQKGTKSNTPVSTHVAVKGDTP